MKYWWLEKYKDLQVKMLPDLFNDIKYFLVMPKDYIELYKKLLDLDVSKFSEEEMCIYLYGVSITKNVKNSNLRQVIERMLLIPDTSLPISDYTLEEILDEIKNLRTKRPTLDKLENNNVAACYNCLNVFYVDKIQQANKKGLCLCPFCQKPKLYFDNDLVPMNYSFLLLSKMYYGISNLGCDFTNLKKLLKQGIVVSKVSSQIDTVICSGDFDLLNEFQFRKIYSEDESKVIKCFLDIFSFQDSLGKYEIELKVEWNSDKNLFELSLLLVLACIYSLSNTFYLKKINVYIENNDLRKNFKSILRQIVKND